MQGHFPNRWKVDKTIPIRKPKKPPDSAASYRLITHLNMPREIVERQISAIFKKKHTSSNNLVLGTQYSCRAKGLQECFLLTWKKAFDSIWLKGLINNLIILNFLPYFIQLNDINVYTNKQRLTMNIDTIEAILFIQKNTHPSAKLKSKRLRGKIRESTSELYQTDGQILMLICGKRHNTHTKYVTTSCIHY